MNPSIYPPAEDSYLLSSTLSDILPKLLSKNPNLKFLEIGCGSGIQLETALKTGMKKENIFGADINNNAVRHCMSLGFNCIKSNLFDKIKDKYDIIIFNPPYLPEDNREPGQSRIATTGGKKGGEIINRFIKRAKKYLNKRGKIILLVSSLTKGIDLAGYEKKLLAEKSLFFEKLYIFELSLPG